MAWRNDSSSYGWVSIALHWLVAILFLCQLPLGYLTQAAQDSPDIQAALYRWHESVGFLILALAVPRLVWALSSRTPDLPAEVTPSERSAAGFAHIVLYALTVFVPLAGWAVVSAAVPPMASRAFGFAVAKLPLAASTGSEAMWSSIHAFLAYGAGFLSAVHILAALRHHFRFHDTVMIRMLWPGPHGEA